MRYIGNKTRLLKKIALFIEENKISGDTFCDLFAGTGSVGDYFKGNYSIIANDIMYFSKVLSNAKLNNYKRPVFSKFVKKFGHNPFDYFNNKEYVFGNNFFVTKSYTPEGNRKFLSKENGIKIDGIRIELEEFYRDKYFNDNEYNYILASLIDSVTRFSNTSGTYEAFLKHWDNRSIKKFKLTDIEYKKVKPKGNNINYCKDANSLIREIEGDILYIDPPYTITEYSSAYHLLETVAKYDYPEIAGKTARRQGERKKSNYTRKLVALESFEDLIRQARFKQIIVSYSNQSIIPLNELTEMLKQYSINKKVIVKSIAYREYKNIRTSQKGDKLEEVIIYIEKDIDFVKSPLNYSGSKNDLIVQMHKHFPSKINTFYDMTAGAFNVGANVVCNKVVYNEYNPYIFNLVKYLLKTRKSKILKDVEKTIEEFNLDNGSKMNYHSFRDFYNENQTEKNLFVLSMFCFQNQLRFNSKMKFNTPVGNCGYNSTHSNRVKTFKVKAKEVQFKNVDFLKIDFKKSNIDDVFYFDPPYFITNATYNDGKRGFKGWDSNQETQLLDYITKIHLYGRRFILSNVIEHKGKINHILEEWIQTHGFKVINLKHSRRKEVLIINFDFKGGIR